MNKIIFLNTGWMHKYKGLGSDKISGGGKHVDKTGWGGEMFNFLPQNNKYFGYAETWGAINLNRIDPDLKNDFIDNI